MPNQKAMVATVVNNAKYSLDCETIFLEVCFEGEKPSLVVEARGAGLKVSKVGAEEEAPDDMELRSARSISHIYTLCTVTTL